MTSRGTTAAPAKNRPEAGLHRRAQAGDRRATDHNPGTAPRVQIGEAAARRHTAPIASMTLWGAFCGSTIIALHKLSAGWGASEGSYRTGIFALSLFVLASLYPVRKYTLWFSLRYVRVASRLPQVWAVRLLLLDRLETWRVAHITLGVFAMLPFWWHTQFGRRSLLESALELLVIMLVLSGFLGTFIEDFLPARMLTLGNQEVRLEDVEAASHALYVQAEEQVLGHSEAVVHAYLLLVRPILAGSQASRTLLWATLTGSNPAAAVCKPARLVADGFGTEAAAFHELIDIAEHKVRLDHNQFNLKLSNEWLRLHRGLAVSVFALVIFHVLGVLYFAGV